jgi:hypothetical protein
MRQTKGAQLNRLLVLLATVTLAFPASALPKGGPAGAWIDGPGTGGAIDVPGAGDNVGTPLGDLTHYAGFFPAVYRQTPDPMSKDRPKGDLGPKYTVTYSVPMGAQAVPRDIRQDMYPYANPPVTYTEPGQRLYDDTETHGGWYTKGISALRVRLIEAGLLPAKPPIIASSDDDGGLVSTGTVLAVVPAMALLLLATAFLLRRRPRTAV